ncbi:MAG TPA: glycosyltransferase [Thermoguttaceae bacterium]|nr:glycosyltransferase [Thermoguttaceae bacterium]
MSVLLLGFQMPVRLLILCEYPTLSGGERSMLATMDGVTRAGFDVQVMGPGEGALAEACRARGILLVASGEAEDGSLAGRRERLAREIARLRPDVLHANSLAMGRLSGPVAAELGVASVAHLRDIIRLSRQAVCDLNRHRRLLAVSEATRQFHVAAGLDAEKTFVLYNGVDLARFCPRPATGYLHRELGIPAGATLVGSIGQISLRKGQEVLLEAVLRVNANGVACSSRLLKKPSRDREGAVVERFGTPPLPHGRGSDESVHWLIVGERWSDKEESRGFEVRLHAMAEELNGRVHFLGARGDVAELLNELTLLVHTARQEPLGRVLLEAAASGVAVVATDVGGTREIFPEESGAARLIPPNDAEAVAGAVAELLADEGRRRAMGAAARRRAEEQFDVARATAGLIGHYRAVVE